MMSQALRLLGLLGLLLGLGCVQTARGQELFAPAPGLPGSTAIAAADPRLVNWAQQGTVQRGWRYLASPDSGFASAGELALALGPAGPGGALSLGDGGAATLTFPRPIRNGPGFDFAVFENGFASGDGFFLELAFVEVSSDGQRFVRFPAVSLTDTTRQIGPFDLLQPTQLDQLAGKYPFGWGVPFDLEVLRDSTGLDVERITHVRVVDVVGSLDPRYLRRDARQRPINDPWPTPFASSGFDLDAIGVLHEQPLTAVVEGRPSTLRVFPNPARDWLQVEWSDAPPAGLVRLVDAAGKILRQAEPLGLTLRLSVGDLPPGPYFLMTPGGTVHQVVVQK